MGKKIIGVIAFAAIAAAAGWNYQQNTNEVQLSDLALENVEALALGETDDEFYEKTGCYAVWENTTCHGKDGNSHTYASSTRP